LNIVSSVVFGSGSIRIIQIRKSKNSPPKKKKKFSVLKSWKFSLKGWRLLLELKVFLEGLRRNIFKT
jgi:hypothetical protein